jgi:hypothetical protein
MKERVAWPAAARRGRLVVRNGLLRSARRSVLFAAVCMVLSVCVSNALRRAPRSALREPPPDAAFKCVVLTLNASARVDPRCTRFLGTRATWNISLECARGTPESAFHLSVRRHSIHLARL